MPANLTPLSLSAILADIKAFGLFTLLMPFLYTKLGIPDKMYIYTKHSFRSDLCRKICMEITFSFDGRGYFLFMVSRSVVRGCLSPYDFGTKRPETELRVTFTVAIIYLWLHLYNAFTYLRCRS
jgi:hypothetical protein